MPIIPPKAPRSPLPRPEYSIKVAESKDEIEACYDIRIEVFVVEMGFPHDTEIDDLDPISIQFLLSIPSPTPPPTSTSSITTHLSQSLHLSTSPSQPSSSTTAPTHIPIGTIRFTPSLSKLARFAILPSYRSYGFGEILITKLEDYLRFSGEEIEGVEVAFEGQTRGVRIMAHAATYLLPLYKRLGYVTQGEIFDEEGAPHQKVTKFVAFDQKGSTT